MTPDEMLAPQPPTQPGEDRRPVWQMIEADLEWGRYGPEFDAHRVTLATLARARDAQGRAKYGVPLPVDSGRNSRLDELQEALDGMAYSRQTYEQSYNEWEDAADEKSADAANLSTATRRAWARHLRCLQTVLELLEEIGT